MKKFLSFILAACMTVSAGALLTACEDGFTETEWNEALAESNFDNVTAYYTFESMEMKQEHTVKIADGLVYRSMLMDGEKTEVCFEGAEALEQKNVFVNIFLALLADRDNYEYDDGVYTNSETVKVTLHWDAGDMAGMSENIEMKDGEVKFDENGNLECFSCYMTETVYNADGSVLAEIAGNTTWTFADYGTTKIRLPEEEPDPEPTPDLAPEEGTEE